MKRFDFKRKNTTFVLIGQRKLLTTYGKIASDHQKPDGLTLIPETEKVQFLRPLPVRVLYGVGKWQFHAPDGTDHLRRTAERSQGHLPAGLFSIGPV